MRNLFNKNFNLLIIGQIISVVVNSTINFTLGLYILKVSGSAELFGIVTAVSIIPWAICAPLGGALADKYNTRNVMVILDFACAFILLMLILFSGDSAEISIYSIIIVKILLSAMQAAYYPCVISCVVSLVRREDLPRANSIISQINSLSNIVSPMVAGFLYAFLNVKNILYIAMILFAFSAILELFMKVPKKADLSSNGNEKSGIKEAFVYIFKNDKNLLKYLMFSSIICGAITGIVLVGLPYIINIYLGLSSEYYGFASGVVSCGTLVAGFLLFVFPHKFSFRKSGVILTIIASIISLSGVVLFTHSKILVFLLLCVCVFALMVFVGMFYIMRNVYIQHNTPQELLGKVMALMTVLCGFLEPFSQMLYGFLFGAENLSVALILILSGVVILPVSLTCVKISKQLK